MVSRHWRALTLVLMMALLPLAGCGVVGNQLAPEGDEASPTLAVTLAVRAETTPAPTIATPVSTAPPGEDLGPQGLPVILRVPEGWTLREITDGVIIIEDEATLAAPELECAALLVRRLPGATTPREVLATYDLSLAVRQREVPLVIARNPVDAIDATLVSDTTGRVYQVVLAPLVIKGEALLFIASMPEGQADQAWPRLATILGSVAFAGD